MFVLAAAVLIALAPETAPARPITEPSASFVIALRGEIVKGWGDTKRAAMEDADARAKKLADEKGTCFTAAKLEDVKKDPDGGWIATASVANHQGSCRR